MNEPGLRPTDCLTAQVTGKFKSAMGVTFLWTIIAVEAICLACIWIVLRRRPSVRRKIVMSSSIRCHSLRAVGRSRSFETTSSPVRFIPCQVPIEPYALGLLLGDGCITGSTTPSFAT